MRNQSGFSYVIVMFLVAVLSLVSVRALESTLTREKRDKEAQLLEIGMAYLKAIEQYYNEAPGSAQSYPAELDALLYDDRLTRPQRPLRKLFRDPISGSAEWGVVRNAAGAVIGVHSLSAGKPFKQQGFPAELQSFAGAQRYSDWKFIYQPPLQGQK
ncbi:type II secretion system protein [Pseudoduganella sp. FT55W]|uniref:Type II secretion system protein n=1 Tax=Duganella rivi TaxID=2666083 RepID=A0A7X4GQJ6_9BURK|nr:type II secretion system protein [Duganella rivi]MYM67698.1 type II secretion system protein [Duganella rivi]